MTRFIVRKSGHGDCEGFTLIEVLVAIMVLSISMTIIFQLFSGAIRARDTADDYVKAMFAAKSKMEEILLAPGLSDGISFGELENGMRWEAVFEHRVAEDGKPPLIDTFKITLRVFWKEGEREKQVSLHTIQIADNLAPGNAGPGQKAGSDE